MLRRTMAGVVVATLLVAGTGCLKRKEKITIAPDGAADIVIEYRGSKQDFGGRDVLPTAAAGWEVTRTTETKRRPDGSDEQEDVLRAEQRFAPGQPLPANFASPADPNAELYTQFPTRLTVEQRPDGTYYHLRRTYAPRRWAHVQYWKHVFINDDIEKLVEKPSESLTTDERAKIFAAFASFEWHRQVELAKAALADAEPNLAPDAWLRARAALRGVYESVAFAQLAARYESMSKEQADAELEEEADRFMANAREAFSTSLRGEPAMTEARMAAITAALDRQNLAHDVTSVTGGHNFEIRAVMPGQIVGHNADRMDEQDDGALVWEFSGEAFRDRTHELLATSRLAK